MRSGREGGLRIRVLGVLRGGGVAVHQSVRLGDLLVLVGSVVELLRREGRLLLLLLSGHGVDGRTHGLVMMAVCNGGGTPALGRCLGRLCDGGQRARRRSICSFRHAGSARALAAARLGLRRAGGSTGGIHGDW